MDEYPSAGYQALERVGDFWTPARLEWTGSTCTLTPIDTIEYGVKYCLAAGSCDPSLSSADAGDCINQTIFCDLDTECRVYEHCSFFDECVLNDACAVDADCPSGQTCDVDNLGGLCIRAPL